MVQERQTQTRLIADVVFATPAARPLLLDLLLPQPMPQPPPPLLLHLHGGGWKTGDKQVEDGRFLVHAGYAAASAQYRFSQEATFPAQVHDVKLAVRWLRDNAATYGYDPDRIGVWGHSAGGHLSAFLGTSAGLEEYEGPGLEGVDSSVQAVVNVSGVMWLFDGKDRPAASPTGLLLGAAPASVPDLARAFSPASHIRRQVPIPPFLHLHGTDDALVPLKHAAYLHDHLRAAGVDSTLIPVSGGDHQLRGQWPVVEQLTRAFFDRVLAWPDDVDAER